MKDELIIPQLKQGEELIGFFYAWQMPSSWWFILFGPLIALGRKSYYVAVTNQGFYFYKLTFFGKPDKSDYFTWDEIENLKFKKGLLNASLELKFSNGRKLRLTIQTRGGGKAAKLDERTKEFLLSKAS